MISKFFFNKFRKAFPPISQTEQEALEAGDTWWDKQLFSGNPDWSATIGLPHAALNKEEAKFIEGPVQRVCEMLDDYDITDHRADLPEEVWNILKGDRFFGMIIPKEYGGLGFSHLAHSQVVVKLATRSIAAAVTVMVPNSLGPAELLLRYGTEREKDYYLPRLARGIDIPCFALTSPLAGSDASSMVDVGYVGEGIWKGEPVIGLYLEFDKRYITLAPVSTLFGLAFKIEDPYNLLKEYDQGVEPGTLKPGGITLALIPSDHPGVEIGHRHNPLNAAFMNGPIRGSRVFIPMDFIIGGVQNMGKGWKMLMECLAAGRAISLPSLACAGTKLALHKSVAYTRVRKQFKVPICKFEGVEEKIAKITGYAFIMDSTRTLTMKALDARRRPAVISAICKYHLTEMNREVINWAMDIQGGSGISLGPNNFIGKSYQTIPISITVEGANILTRNMIIFGQGVVRCHPFLYEEMQALQENNFGWFKRTFRDHLFWTIGNFFEAKMTNLVRLFTKSTLSRINHFSAAFAFTVDVTLLLLGGKLKRKERISARLGDILSYMYMLTAIDHFRDQVDDPVYEWAESFLLYKIQEAFYDLFRNYPSKIAAKFLRLLIFPYGKPYKLPTDKLEHEVAELALDFKDSKTRYNLTRGVFTSKLNTEDKTYALEQAFRSMEQYEYLEKIINRYKEYSFDGKVDQAVQAGTITKEDGKFAKRTHYLIEQVIKVDEFEVI